MYLEEREHNREEVDLEHMSFQGEGAQLGRG